MECFMRIAFRSGLLASTALLLTACGKSPEATVEAFYLAVGKGEITEAKGYLAPDVARMLPDAKLTAALSAEASRVQDCGGIKSISVDLSGEGEIRSGKAEIEYRGECPRKTEKVKLIKVEGKWRIGVGK
jgi:hypothetical protein